MSRARCVVNATGVWADDVRALDEGAHPAIDPPGQGRAHHAAVGRGCATTSPPSFPSRARRPHRSSWSRGGTHLRRHHRHRLRRAARRPGVHRRRRRVPPRRAERRHHVKADEVADVVRHVGGPATAAHRRRATPAPPTSRAATRVRVSPSGVVTVTGGKLTTYRRMAADAVDAAVRRARPTTSTARRPSASGSSAATASIATPPNATTSSAGSAPRRGGAQASCDADPALGEPLVPGLPYLKAEAVYAARHEMARTLDDVLSRRTRARLLDARRVDRRRGRRRRRAHRARAGLVGRRARARGRATTARPPARTRRDAAADARRRARRAHGGHRDHAASVAPALGACEEADAAPPPSTHRPPPRGRRSRRSTPASRGPTAATASSAAPSPCPSTGGDRRASTVPLALIRRPASSPDARIGSLVVNYGRPGPVGGVDYLRSRCAPAARRRAGPLRPRELGPARHRQRRARSTASTTRYLDLRRGHRRRCPTPRTRSTVSHAYNDRLRRRVRRTRSGAYAGQVGHAQHRA